MNEEQKKRLKEIIAENTRDNLTPEEIDRQYEDIENIDKSRQRHANERLRKEIDKNMDNLTNG